MITPGNPKSTAQQLRQIAKKVAKADEPVAVYCLFYDSNANGNAEVVSLFPIGIGTQLLVECFKEFASQHLDDTKMEFMANNSGNETVQ